MVAGTPGRRVPLHRGGNDRTFARSPLEEHGTAFDTALGLKDMFAAKARELHGEAYPPAFRSFAEEEKKATDLFICEHSLVPGIFQTERYAQAILQTHPNTSDATVRERVAGRLARQEIITRDGPASAVCVGATG